LHPFNPDCQSRHCIAQIATSVPEFQPRTVASEVYQYIMNPLIVIEFIEIWARQPGGRGIGDGKLRNKDNENSVVGQQMLRRMGFAPTY